MRIWLKILAGVVALVLVLATVAVIFVAYLDPNDYRDSLSDLVEDATGRSMRIGGDLRIRLWPNPAIEANDVSFANAEWASQPDMLRIARLDAEILLVPLLRGTLVVQRFVAIEPRIFLETDASGRGNWQLAAGEQTSPEKDAASSSRGMSLALNQVQVENAALDYLDGASGSRRELRVDALEVRVGHAGSPPAVELRARYQDLPITADGTIGTANAVLRNEPFPIDIRGSLGEAGFTLHGVIGRPLDGEQLQLGFTSSIPATKPISDAFDVELEEFGPVEVAFELGGDVRRLDVNPFSIAARPRGSEVRVEGSLENLAAQHFSSRAAATPREPMQVDMHGRLGEARVHVEGDVGNLVTASNVRLRVRAETPSTRPLTELAGIELEELGAVKLSLAVLGEDGRFDLDDIVLDARPRDTATTVSGSVKDLVIAGEHTGAAPARVDLQGTFGETRFSVAGDVGRPLQGKDLNLKVTVAADSTRALTELAGVDVEELGPLDAALTVVEKDGRFDLEDIDVKARPREAKVTIEGAVTDVTAHPSPDVRVTIAARSLRQLRKDLPAAGPVEVSARVEPMGEVIEIRELDAKVGKSDLSGSATLRTGGKRPSASANLRSTVIDMRELAPADAQPDSRDSDESGDARAENESSASKRVFPDKALPFDELKKADGEIQLVVDRLFTHKLSLDQVNLSATLDDGKLTVKPAASVAGGKFSGTVGIDSSVQPAKIEASFDAKGISLGKLSEEIRGFETSQGLASNLKTTLTGRGDSVRAIMGGLNGELALEIGEGRLANDVLNRVGADFFMQVLGALVPKDDEDGATRVDCGVIRFEVENGQAVAEKTVMMLTDKVLVSGSGVVNLENEDLDLGAVLVARKGIRIGAGSLSNMLRVRGTIANPQLGTDLTGVTKTGVKISAAVFTAGLSLLAEGLVRQVAEDKDPCRTALERPIDMSPNELKRLFAVH